MPQMHRAHMWRLYVTCFKYLFFLIYIIYERMMGLGWYFERMRLRLPSTRRESVVFGKKKKHLLSVFRLILDNNLLAIYKESRKCETIEEECTVW